MFNFLLESGTQGGSSWITIAMIGLVFVVFYFLLIRPEKKRERAAGKPEVEAAPVEAAPVEAAEPVAEETTEKSDTEQA